MPYFFKLSNMINVNLLYFIKNYYNNSFLNLFEFALADFITGCSKHYSNPNSSVSMIFFLFNHDEL